MIEHLLPCRVKLLILFEVSLFGIIDHFLGSN